MGVIKPDRASNTLIHNLSRSIFWKIESRKEKERVQGLARAPHFTKTPESDCSKMKICSSIPVEALI